MIKILINEKMAFWFIWFGVDSSQLYVLIPSGFPRLVLNPSQGC